MMSHGIWRRAPKHDFMTALVIPVLPPILNSQEYRVKTSEVPLYFLCKLKTIINSINVLLPFIYHFNNSSSSS